MPHQRPGCGLCWEDIRKYTVADRPLEIQQLVSGLSQEVTRVNHMPLLHFLRIADGKGTMKCTTLVDEGIATVGHVDDEMAEVIKLKVKANTRGHWSSHIRHSHHSSQRATVAVKVVVGISQ